MSKGVAATMTILCAAVVVSLSSAAVAHAQGIKGTLGPDLCHVREATGSGTFSTIVTTSHRTNDVYQIICEDDRETCWVFSFNRGDGGTVMTAGLTPGTWTWWICTWPDNVGRTKYQAAGLTSDLVTTGSSLVLGDSVELVDAGGPSAPEAIRRLRAPYLGGNGEQ